jgi:O-antigen/teichoic acid export membrane protein
MNRSLRRFLPDVAVLGLFLALSLLFFWPQMIGGRTLVPADNLFGFEPFRSMAEEVGVGTPHNALLSDLILENYVWKQFIRESIAAGELPLWQPYILAGSPFLAAGQSSALYPFSVLFYILPLYAAYGWFTVTQVWLAAATMYLLMRVLGIRRLGAALSGIAYAFSGFYMVSVVFPMIIAAAAWLPFELAMIELVLRQAPAPGGRPATLPWMLLGALGLTMAALAGHVEALYFILLVMGFYAAWRLIAEALATHEWRRPAGRAAWLLGMVALGLATAAVQIVPAYELVSRSFREGAATLAEVRGWAYPPRRALAFLMPNFFGNPSHHSTFDVFTWQWQPVTQNVLGDPIQAIDWGIKNYVEGGAYLGILTMALALVAVILWIGGRLGRTSRHAGAEGPGRPYRVLFFALAAASVSFVFGTPTYAILYYGLPFINQSHSPFRWVWPLTLSVAALAGFGADALQKMWRPSPGDDSQTNRRGEACLAPTDEDAGVMTLAHRLAHLLGWGGIWSGVAVWVALALSRIFYGRIAGLVERVFMGLARAPEAFPDARAFYSYEAWNVFLFGAMLLVAGIVVRVSKCGIYLPPRLGGRPAWEVLAIGVLFFDLGVASYGFHPAADPALLETTPPAVAFLQSQEGLWRFTSYEPPGAHTMNANSGWLYGLQDARGYDSLIPGQYAQYMATIAPQVDLQYNRIAPIYTTEPTALDSPMLDLLGVRYVISEVEIDNPRYERVYQDDAVRVYENLGAMPRAFTLPVTSTVFVREGEVDPLYRIPLNDFAGQVQITDVHHNVLAAVSIYEDGLRVRMEGPLRERWAQGPLPAEPGAATITDYGASEVWIDAAVEEESWLVLTDSSYPGWRAWIRPQGAEDSTEEEIPVWLVDGNFRGIILPPGEWTIRFKYSPDCVRFGGFASFLAAMGMVFAAGVWAWRYVYREEANGGERTAVQRIAKNSLTPIVLNLFNRLIDFAFAFVSLRILQPEGAGKYYYAIIIWGWFEILTNFGLNTLLTREVARDRDSANRYFVNTTLLRLALVVVGVPLLVGFLALRQGVVSPPLTTDTLWTIGLLYAGLLPGTLSAGLTALFYAYEKAEHPAALTTVTTFLKAGLGVTALLLGMGIVGLAGVSIITNLVTFAVLYWLATRLFLHPRLTLDMKLQRAAIVESFPLMLNHLLATLFFKVNVILMEGIAGDVVVGWYSTAYKWVDALNIIPSFFTQAFFPVISRAAKEDRGALCRAYILAVKLLVMVALPTAVATTLLSRFLIGFLGGPEYLPHGAIALHLMIWSIPIGWINSVTNYVLIALDRQRILTRAFIVGVAFNVAANLIFLPRYGYPATAIIAMFSELVLLIAFYLTLVRALAPIPWGRILWRPVLATLLMAGMTAALASTSTLLALAAGAAVYGAALALLHPLEAHERAWMAPLLPARLRGRLGFGKGSAG